MIRFLKLLGRLCLWTLLLAITAWGCRRPVVRRPGLAPAGRPARAGLCAGHAGAADPAAPQAPRLRCRLILFAVLLGWWFSLHPSNDRDWQPNVAQLPSAEIHGDTLVVHNLRNFDYRSETDFTPRWETRRYDLSKLRGLDLHVIYWGSPSIAHTILSWEFDDGQRLAASIETRTEMGESYSAVRGFFRQFELYYVLADERDVIGLRTNHRHEDVYLYRLRTPPARARALLLDYLQTVNRLANKPKWYNAFSHNCTTTIRLHAGNAMGTIPLDWRWLANGYLDQLLYEKGVINRDRPFAELKSLSYINPSAKACRWTAISRTRSTRDCRRGQRHPKTERRSR